MDVGCGMRIRHAVSEHCNIYSSASHLAFGGVGSLGGGGSVRCGLVLVDANKACDRGVGGVHGRAREARGDVAGFDANVGTNEGSTPPSRDTRECLRRARHVCGHLRRPCHCKTTRVVVVFFLVFIFSSSEEGGGWEARVKRGYSVQSRVRRVSGGRAPSRCRGSGSMNRRLGYTARRSRS